LALGFCIWSLVAFRGAAVGQIVGWLGRKVAKQEYANGTKNPKLKSRKRNFKTESWYAEAAPKMSAARSTTNLGMQKT
jgi:hypothetical protein